MQKKRLLMLADYLETIPKKRFNLALWADGEFCGLSEEPSHDKCGTAACAMGWASTLPAFRKAGLTLIKRTPNESLQPAYHARNDPSPHFAWNAAVAFFGLKNISPAFWLFHGDAYPSKNKTQPKTVARRIRQFVADDGAFPENIVANLC